MKRIATVALRCLGRAETRTIQVNPDTVWNGRQQDRDEREYFSLC